MKHCCNGDWPCKIVSVETLSRGSKDYLHQSSILACKRVWNYIRCFLWDIIIFNGKNATYKVAHAVTEDTSYVYNFFAETIHTVTINSLKEGHSPYVNPSHTHPNFLPIFIHHRCSPRHDRISSLHYIWINSNPLNYPGLPLPQYLVQSQQNYLHPHPHSSRTRMKLSRPAVRVGWEVDLLQ